MIINKPLWAVNGHQRPAIRDLQDLQDLGDLGDMREKKQESLETGWNQHEDQLQEDWLTVFGTRIGCDSVPVTIANCLAGW